MAGSQVGALGASGGAFSRRTTRCYILLTAALILTIALIVGVAVGVTVGRGDDQDEYVTRANALLQRVPLVDGHNDFAWNLRQNYNSDLGVANISENLLGRPGWYEADSNHPSQTDIPRLRKGNVGGVFWSVFTLCLSRFKDVVKKGLQQIDLIRRFSARYPEHFEFVTEADGVLAANSRGHIASMVGIEGGHFIDNDMDVLRMYYALGARYMTLTWSCDLLWADSYMTTRENRTGHGGLTPWGELFTFPKSSARKRERVVSEMNRLGMMIDLAHVGWSTMEDVFRLSSAPVIYSHSSAFEICPHHRNVPDDLLRKLKKNNGIIMVNLYAGFINCTEETRYKADNRTGSIQQVMEHMNHIRKTAGVDHMGIGADFDGMDRTVEGLSDVSTYPTLFAELLRSGWTEDELEKVASGNIIRVWKAVEAVRDQMKEKDPDETPFPDEIPQKACSSPWMDD